MATNDVHAASFSEEEFQDTMFSEEEEFQAMILDQDDLRSTPLFSSEDVLQPQVQAAQSAVYGDDVRAPFPEAALGCEDDIQEILAAQQPSPQSGAPRSDGEDDKENERPPSWQGDGKEDPKPPVAAPRRRAKRRSSKKRRKRQQMLRSWHRWIATCILTRQFRAPELSGGRTALRCLCLELAGAEGHHRGCCALHQDNAPGRAWIHAAHGGGVPLLCGGPGEVRVPTLAAGDGAVAVVQYARWRRSVWLPTRFYVQQRAVEKKLVGFEFEEPGDDD